MAAKQNRELSNREAMFVHELLADPTLNAYQAALRAGYTESTAKQASVKLMRRATVKKLLAERRAQMASRAKCDGQRIVNELGCVVTARVSDLFGDDGRMLGPKEWPEHMQGAVASIEYDEITVGSGEDKRVIGRTSKVKLWPKIDAADKLMKHLGLYKADNEQRSDTMALFMKWIQENGGGRITPK